MIEAVAGRFVTGDTGTYSSVIVPGALFACVFGELPWRGNAKDISCIPEGVYRCTKEFLTIGREHHFGYRVHEVPGRTGILIHRGNFCGDTTKGWKTDVQGCLLPGMEVGQIYAYLKGRGAPGVMQDAVKSSKTALDRLLEVCGEEFTLKIESRCGTRFLA
jgi:hypothetical protein